MCGIGFCLTSCLCCAGQACCKLICLPFKKMGVAAKNYAKVGYVVFQIIMILLAVTAYYLWRWLGDTTLADFGAFDCDSLNDGACAGASVIVRMSWSLAIFQVLILLITFARNKCAAAVHDGFWGVKFLLVTGIFIGSMWIPNDPVMNGYMTFSKWVSIVFLTYQAALILIMAYILNDALVSNVQNEGDNAFSCSGIILIVIFLCFLGGDITWIVFQYINFAGEGCGGNTTIITITTVIGCLTFLLVFLRPRPDASVLTSSIVLAYCLYLEWVAMTSNPDLQCNQFAENQAGNATFEIIMGMIFLFFSLISIAGSTSKDNDPTVANGLGTGLLEEEGEGVEEDMEAADAQGETHVFPISTATILFQVLMVFSAIYFAMLMTNWANLDVLSNSDSFFETNKQAYWINLCAMWAAQALYLFSLTAPFCIDRDFGGQS